MPRRLRHRLRALVRRLLSLGVVASVCRIPVAAAFETDQFTMPPAPLADIGPEVDAHLRRLIDANLALLNSEIDAARAALAASTTDAQRTRHAEALRVLWDPATIAQRVHDGTSLRMPETEFEHWVNVHPFSAQPARFAPHWRDTIYAGAARRKPLLVVGLAPTVNLFGVLQGTDKVGHILQQGHDYAVAYWQARAQGGTERDALDAAIAYGVEMERTWGGLWWTGVYSNADLAANYAGLELYRNLAEPVTVGARQLPPILALVDGRWRWNPRGDGHLLGPFITDHLDEAMNPSWTNPPLRELVRPVVAARAPAWLAARHTGVVEAEAHTRSLTTWFGAPYGHTGVEEIVTVWSAGPCARP